MTQRNPDSKVGLKNDYAQGDTHVRRPFKRCVCGLPIQNLIASICDDCERERALSKRGKTKTS